MDEVATGTTAGPATLARLFRDRAVSSPGDLAFRHRVGGPGREAWEDVSWEHARALVEPLAAGLTGLGVEPGDRVVVLSRTRVDWVLAHLAVLCAAATTVAVHPGGTPEEVARHIDGAGAVVVVAEDVDQADTLRRVRGDIRTVRKVVLLDGSYPDRRVMTFEALLAHGEDALDRDPGTIARRVDALRPDVLATVLHAPGAGPTAAGERRTHAAWVLEGRAAEGGDEGLRHLFTPLHEHEGHALLAAQLVHGFGVRVDRSGEPGE
ncbi:AMP-binding protein [Nocardioides terrigena]|uniref:AMP-binding protein n=1 Tax=Nocardioides terrigena TaxID=424797 RepID=UPI00131F168C|nr:AMP-binding protein [Nocardioides terrigena]